MAVIRLLSRSVAYDSAQISLRSIANAPRRLYATENAPPADSSDATPSDGRVKRKEKPWKLQPSHHEQEFGDQGRVARGIFTDLKKIRTYERAMVRVQAQDAQEGKVKGRRRELSEHENLSRISGIQMDADDMEDLLDVEYMNDDTTSLGWAQIQAEGHVLGYLRLIEHEVPKLVAYRKVYEPPTSDRPVIVRSISYGGERHPVTNKRVVTVAVDELPLRDENAIHRIKILAGPRWSPKPHADGGISSLAHWGNGYIKISCENFPKAEMNLKWASDALDRLIQEANEPQADKYKNIPVDLRHIFAKAKKARNGEHLRGRIMHRPTIHDFPKEWLHHEEIEVTPEGAIINPQIV